MPKMKKKKMFVTFAIDFFDKTLPQLSPRKFCGTIFILDVRTGSVEQENTCIESKTNGPLTFVNTNTLGNLFSCYSFVIF